MARQNRTLNGGGLLIAALDHLLVDTLDISRFNYKCVAELVGIEYNDQQYILCYTPNSSLAPKLCSVLEEYLLAYLGKSITFLGDFDAHNPGWIPSTTPLDAAGTAVQELSENFDLTQHIDFPTRAGNTLDLVFSPCNTVVAPDITLGTSDHISIWISFDCSLPPKSPPLRPKLLQWGSAPWSHIKGHLRRELSGWNAGDYATVNEWNRLRRGRPDPG